MSVGLSRTKQIALVMKISIDHFRVALHEPHYENEAKCKIFIIKISFHPYKNKTNFYFYLASLS